MENECNLSLLTSLEETLSQHVKLLNCAQIMDTSIPCEKNKSLFSDEQTGGGMVHIDMSEYSHSTVTRCLRC